MANLYGPRIVTDGLVLHLDAGNRKSYPLSGNTIYDLSGNGYDGTFGASTAAPTFSGDNGGCLSFDGSNDYVSISHSLDLNNTYTFVTFFKFDSFVAVNPRIFEIRDSTYSLQLIRDNASSTISTWSSRINSNTGTARRWFTPSLNIWYHITTIFTTTATYLYLNGVEQTSPGTTGIGPGNQNNKIILGVRSDNVSTTWLDGNIATFTIYNRLLSATEIRQNFEAVKGRFGL